MPCWCRRCCCCWRCSTGPSRCSAAAAALVALLLGLAARAATRARAGAIRTRPPRRPRGWWPMPLRCAEAVEAHGHAAGAGAPLGGRAGARHRRAAPRAGRRAPGRQAAIGALDGIAPGGAVAVGVLVIAGRQRRRLRHARGRAADGARHGALLRAGGTQIEEPAAARAAWHRLDRAAARPTRPRRRRATPRLPLPRGAAVLERVTLVHPGAAAPAAARGRPGGRRRARWSALAGPPGTGKSTLLRVMLGLQPTNAGEAFLDGHATAQWDRADLARHRRLPAAGPAAGGETVAEAIARLAPAPDMAAVMRAARLAGALPMVAGLPQGFATRARRRAARSRWASGSASPWPARSIGAPRAGAARRAGRLPGRRGRGRGGAADRDAVGGGTAVVFTSHREALLRAREPRRWR